jgi:hypothetical protein
VAVEAYFVVSLISPQSGIQAYQVQSFFKPPHVTREHRVRRNCCQVVRSLIHLLYCLVRTGAMLQDSKAEGCGYHMSVRRRMSGAAMGNCFIHHLPQLNQILIITVCQPQVQQVLVVRPYRTFHFSKIARRSSKDWL